MLEQLIHNGILVLTNPAPQIEMTIRGERRLLTPRQAEMALAWAKKLGTPYVKDAVFARNFMQDFSAELGIDPPLKMDEVDFASALRIVQAERAAREQLSPEERKALAAERKARREQLKEQYGHAIVNGERVELGNYVTEPSGIFMGRGKHPLRGRWKEGPQESDIALNLSPDAPIPPGEWAEIVWQPESLWVARWRDKLSDKLKYVWLSDSAPVKQEREASKFDAAARLEENLAQVRECIAQALSDPNPRRRMVATACYLIDALCLRVGDEKDPDEADTVGATTLRPEHVTLHPDDTAEFRFLGKDSVQWAKKIALPPVVRANLEELIREARPSNSSGARPHPTRDKPQLFPETSSSDVNAFLGEILRGLTAKVFRTHHATQAVGASLESSGVKSGDPDYVKWTAVSLANLEAAVICNHTKAIPANWSERRKRADERVQVLRERLAQRREELRQAKTALTALRREGREKEEQTSTPAQRERVRARYAKRIERAAARVDAAQQQVEHARQSLDEFQARHSVTTKKRAWNLGTSLKSYIDPRVVYRWGLQVDYDVLERYYPQALQRKFAWVRNGEGDTDGHR